MGKCKTCEYWTQVTEEFDKKYHGEWSGECSNENFVYAEGYNKPTTPENGLEYWDYEGYSAGFRTGAKFGCVHWSRRKPQTEKER